MNSIMPPSIRPTAARSVVGTSCRHAAGKPASRSPSTRQAWIARVRAVAFAAAAQDRRVCRLQAQRAGVGRHVRAAFVDDADHAERHAHALDAQAVRARPFSADRADRIGQRRDVFDAARHASTRAASSAADRAPRARRPAALPACHVEQRSRPGCRPCAHARRPPPSQQRAIAGRRSRASAQHALGGDGVATDHEHRLGQRRVGSSQHQVVAVDHLVAPTIAQDGLEVAAAMAADAPARRRWSTRSAHARFRDRRHRARHGVAAVEPALDTVRRRPAAGSCRRAALSRRPSSTCIEPAACSRPAIHCLRAVVGDAPRRTTCSDRPPRYAAADAARDRP